MKLQPAKYLNTPTERQIIDFRGYNKQNGIADGEMRDMQNLSSDGYPFLTQRKIRNVFDTTYDMPTNIHFHDEKMCIVDANGHFYYDGVKKIDLTIGEKQIESINAKIVIFPDKKYYEPKEDIVGNLQGEYYFPTFTEKYDPENDRLLLFGDAISFDNAVNDEYELFQETFKIGDAIKFKGFQREEHEITGILLGYSNNYRWGNDNVERDVALFAPNTFVNITEGIALVEKNITMTREVPDVDYILEHNNRIWGCKDNTIYASKLGDPTNWNFFQGTSQDSYAVDVGSSGVFTGCISAGTHLLFMKDDFMHKLYGDRPSNFQIQTIECEGVEKGSHKSLLLINGIVFYKARKSIMVYTSGFPEEISHALGNVKYNHGVAGTDTQKYYICLEDSENIKHMFVYDIDKGLWHKHDCRNVVQYAINNGEMYGIDGNDGNIILFDKYIDDKEVEWFAEFGDFTEYVENKKIFSKIKMTFDLDENAELSIYLSLDGGDYILLSHISSEIKRTISIPIIPRRCERFSIKLSGVGVCKIQSLVREYRVGSDV